MKSNICDPLGDPKPISFGQLQWSAAQIISQRNNAVGCAALARAGLNFLIRATELNHGAVPLLEQIIVRRLHRAAIRKAKRDKARSRTR